jgi:hypothetical protein
VTVSAPAKVLPRVGHYATNGKRLVYVISESGEDAKRQLLVEDATNPTRCATS